jgi:hypothetical protein
MTSTQEVARPCVERRIDETPDIHRLEKKIRAQDSRGRFRSPDKAETDTLGEKNSDTPPKKIALLGKGINILNYSTSFRKDRTYEEG